MAIPNARRGRDSNPRRPLDLRVLVRIGIDAISISVIMQSSAALNLTTIIVTNPYIDAIPRYASRQDIHPGTVDSASIRERSLCAAWFPADALDTLA